MAPTVTLESDTSCPSADAVRGAIEELGTLDHAPTVFVKVHEAKTGLVIELGWPDSLQPQYRNLSIVGDCAARARAAAIVVAAWLGSLPPTELATPSLEAARPSGGVNAPVGVLSASTPSARTNPWILGLGVGAGTSGDLDVAPVFVLEGTRRLSRRSGLAVVASVGGARRRTVGPGTSRFMRPSMALVSRILVPMGASHLGFDAGLAGGLTVAWGADYPSNDTQYAFNWGPQGALRVLIGTGRARPWLAVRLTYWVRSQRLRYEDPPTGSSLETTVSALEASLSLGCDVGLF